MQKAAKTLNSVSQFMVTSQYHHDIEAGSGTATMHILQLTSRVYY